MAESVGKYVPTPDGLNYDFYKHAIDGVLHFPRCKKCGTYHHPPRFLCGKCASSEHDWVPSSGEGKLFSWTVNHRVFDPGWMPEVPYATVVVEMDEEKVRVVGGLRGLDLADLKIGIPMVAEVEPAGDEFVFVYFRPV